jgi:hypothetical protein
METKFSLLFTRQLGARHYAQAVKSNPKPPPFLKIQKIALHFEKSEKYCSVMK